MGDQIQQLPAGYPLRFEYAIEKLTEVSADLSKMLAVHDQRLNQQEKQMTVIEDAMEKRQEQSEVKWKDVYDTIRVEDKNILEEINKLRQESIVRHESLTEKIAEIQQKLWMYMGGPAVVYFLLAYGPTILKFIK